MSDKPAGGATPAQTPTVIVTSEHETQAPAPTPWLNWTGGEATAELPTGGAASSTTQPGDSTGGSSPTGGSVGGAPVELKEGTKVSQYELIRELGSGGMGTVYLARDLRLGRKVAIKFLQSKDAETTRRFILEARLTASCSHENIVIIYEVGQFQRSPFMVLEYLQGSPLSKIAKPDTKLPPPRAVELMIPVVRALVCAHEQGIVHRDLKPDNIFVTDSGTIKVLDFGIAKVLQGGDEPATAGKVTPHHGTLNMKDAAGDSTRAGVVIGTLKYMSPEQWGGSTGVDHRTDIWAVGVMLFQMLSGKHPLPPDSPLVLTALLQQPMMKLNDVAPDVPPGLAEVVDRCLLKHKDQRFPDARALLRALEPFQGGHITREVMPDASPYAGLSAFQESDAARFFGRSREIAAMVARIRERPLVGLIGPSGVGKSSLVRAGLVPALKQSGENWESLVVRPGRHPMQALASLIAPLLEAGTNEPEPPKDLVKHLYQEPGYVGVVLRRHAKKNRRNVLLFIDQFEELYTLVPEAEDRLAFTACIGSLSDDISSPTRVVASIRSDFLDRVSEDPRLMNEMSQALFFISAPSRDGLRDALVRPAEMAGYRFENDQIVDNMLEHLQTTSSALPLLQFAATKLWEARDPSRKLLTLSSYQALGGIAGALASHADAVMAELTTPGRALARTLLLRLVTSDRTRAIVSMEELEELSRDRAEVRRLVDQLVQARLLVVQTGEGAVGPSVEIVHESLIHSWPTLHRWLEESQEDSEFLEQLRNAAKQWVQKGRDPGLLWRGEMVQEAARFSKRFRGELGAMQREFLKEVFDLDDSAARRKQQLAVGGGVFLAVLLVAAVIALVIIRDSQQRAEANAVVAQRAEAEAKQRLAEVQRKEQERLAAEAEKRKAEAETAKANTQVEMTNEELKKKNEELEVALGNADKQRRAAEDSQKKAEEAARAAKAAQEQAQAAHKATEVLLKKEHERVKRLESQFGAAAIDDLK